MKKLIISLFSLLTFTESYSLTVYDPANHQQNMANYQVMLLQKLEQVKTYTENALQSRQQLEQLKNDTTNLQGIAGLVLGEQSKFLIKGMDDLNAINKNTTSLLRDPENIEINFDNVFKELKDLKGLNSKELSKEIYKLANQSKKNAKENLKTATTVMKLNEKDIESMRTYMKQTDVAKGNLQSTMATKKGIDQLNGKFARLTDLQAKQIIMQVETKAEKNAHDNLLDEQVRRMLEMSPNSKKIADEISRTGRLW